MYFPIVNPRNVNEKLHTVNMVDANNRLVVIAFIPIPTEKLSKETPKANNKVPVLFIVISFFEGLMYSINNWSANNINIIPNIVFGFIKRILVIWYEIITPNIGIIKWNKPTSKLVLNVFFYW